MAGVFVVRPLAEADLEEPPEEFQLPNLEWIRCSVVGS